MNWWDGSIAVKYKDKFDVRYKDEFDVKYKDKFDVIYEDKFDEIVWAVRFGNVTPFYSKRGDAEF